MRHTLTYVADPETGKVYPVPAGGAEDGGEGQGSEGSEGSGEAAGSSEGEGEGEGKPEPLGEGGKKALEAERKARREAEKRAKRADELEAENQRLREGAMSDQEKALEQARQEAAEAARNEALTEVRGKRLATEIRAAATGKFADPEDAAAFLATEDLDPDDPAAIAEAVEELLERKPHLKAGATQATPGDIDQGARDGDGKPQLSQDDLKSMTPAEIVAARKAGQLDRLAKTGK